MRICRGDDYQAKYKMDFLSELGYHTFDPVDLAIERQTFQGEEDFQYGSRWSGVLGVRTYAEGAFATNPNRYNAPVRQRESVDVIPEEIYGQYRQGPIRLRVGNQLAVWGEAFGAYYADIVNPKDMRQAAIGDVANWRLPIPMVNAITFFGDSTFQAIYIPKPFFNKMPSIGNDFVVPYNRFFSGAQLTLNDDRTLPTEFQNGEVGLRATTLISGFDLALFFFSYHDRFPNYAMQITDPSPLGINLQGFHPRLKSVGFTGSKDFNPIVVRWETLYTTGRLFDAFQNGAMVNLPSDQFIGVVGVDYNGFDNARFGLQASKTIRMQDISGALLRKNRTLLSAHINATLWKGPTPDIILSYVPEDGSTLNQFRLTIPTSDQFDLTFGCVLFLGGNNSEFGLFRGGSRAFVQLHGYFGS